MINQRMLFHFCVRKSRYKTFLYNLELIKFSRIICGTHFIGKSAEKTGFFLALSRPRKIAGNLLVQQ